ncbi:uncharacterized protein LOC128201245 [Galleria mellonella]|uniref:Uncharacterized protein LOC128201245 n=1 Tax=Galleria mellonella TaxID=7137 RepID=A0ABM3MQF3_GALME|nr:uncharacterized protein LOC128201245 [Galleria mellonella]
MEPPSRSLIIVIFLLLYVICVLCQKPPTNEVISTQTSSLNICSDTNAGSPTPKLMQSLLTLAAAKGVLPDILPALQTVIPESLLNVIGSTEENFLPSEAPVLETASPNTAEPITSCNDMLSLQKPTNMAIPASTTPSNFIPSYTQTVPLTVTSYNPFTINDIQPQNLDLSQQSVNSCYFDVNDAEVAAPSSINSLHTITNREYITESLGITNFTDIISGISNDYVLPYPVHLRINVSVPNVQAPRHMLPTGPEAYMTTYPYSYLKPPPISQFIPAPPIIIETSRSRFKDWLPVILIAMLNKGYVEDCCCCNNGRYIPIPYPIPYLDNSN